MFTHEWTVQIEWGDCDAAGIVFYPQYFRLFDAATTRLFQAALGARKLEWTDRFGIIGIPLVDAAANFKRPSTHGDVLTVVSRVESMSRSSFVVRHEMYRDGALMLDGHEKRVWAGPHPTEPRRIVAVPIPDDVRDRLSAEV